MLEQVLLTSKGYESAAADASLRQNLPSRGGFAEVFGSAVNDQEGGAPGFLAGLVKKTWSESGSPVGLSAASLAHVNVGALAEDSGVDGKVATSGEAAQKEAGIFPFLAFKEGLPSESEVVAPIDADATFPSLGVQEALSEGGESALSDEAVSLSGVAQAAQKVADVTPESAKERAQGFVFHPEEHELSLHESGRSSDGATLKAGEHSTSEAAVPASSIMKEHAVSAIEHASRVQQASKNDGLSAVKQEQPNHVDILRSPKRNIGTVAEQSKVAHLYADDEVTQFVRARSDIEDLKGLQDASASEEASTLRSTVTGLPLNHCRADDQTGENTVASENAPQWFRSENQKHAFLNKSELPSIEKSAAIQALASGEEEMGEAALAEVKMLGQVTPMPAGRVGAALVESDGSENADGLGIVAKDELEGSLETTEVTLQADAAGSPELVKTELDASAEQRREVVGEFMENAPQDDAVLASAFGASEHTAVKQEAKPDMTSMRINLSQDGAGNSHQANNRSALGGDSGQSGMNSSGQGQQQSGQQNQGQATQQQFMQMAQTMAQNVQTVRQQNLQQNIERIATQNPNVDMTVLASDTETTSDLDMLHTTVSSDRRGQLPQGLQSIGLPVNHARWGNSFGQRVVYMANNQIQQAQITLNPEKLGPVQIKLHVDRDQQVHVVMSAHHGSTREAIELAMPRLREMMEQAGVDLGSVDVSDQREFAENMNGEDETSQQQGSNPSTAELGMEASNEADVTTHTTDNLVDFYA
ncbi:flagellar hook-length control protein FliK [Thiomicrorhabdus sp. zzn3]|uniref:flagellar hook-length control protein FliK n=1 Tax=Thiomicrorhabdus sp. zzn3 TaxID=3039775 RepID=UPI002436B2D1|nr:flagellar hook-length control protein FliK [Thiomicrorhabdus sp. zzn3]MDG6777637.1 flagellar hook-length control protein FliK [Thiomicrorhabdus sp. zzn3]